MRYDIAVIGNDQAAFDMLHMAACAGRRTVGIIPEQRHSAWLMSRALNRLIGQLLADHGAGSVFLSRRRGTPGLLRRLLCRAVLDEIEDQFRLLDQSGVHLFVGEARILNSSTIQVTSGVDCTRTILRASNVIVGTGIRFTSRQNSLGLVARPCPESLLSGNQLPDQLKLLGGDAFGAGFAALFSLFGVKTLLSANLDRPCAMVEMAASSGVRILDDVEYPDEPDVGSVLDLRREVGFTDYLNLSSIGVEPDENGRLWCAENLETWCAGVFGIGEVVGFGSERSWKTGEQASRILNRVTHRIRRPHFLRIHSTVRNVFV
jgi:NAD(P) transhydrogenase